MATAPWMRTATAWLVSGPATRWAVAAGGAAVAYASLHALAGDGGGGDAAPIRALGVAAASRPGLQSVAAIGQYAVPVLGFVAAALWRRRARRPAASSRRLGTLEGLDWRGFQALAAEVFRRQGYQIADSGSDRVFLTLRRDRETFLVQCKHWRDAKVGVDDIRELYRTMHARGAVGGFALTIGRFSRDAHALARQCSVRLIEGDVLGAILREVRQAAPG